MDKVINNEITNSVKDNLVKRINSSIYGTFIIYWLIFHWNFVFSLFFLSEDKIWNYTGLLKNDYLIKKFFNYYQFSFYKLWILPAILTYLTIWIFPKYISIPAFKREEEDQTEKTIFKLHEQKKIVSAQTALETENTRKISAVVKKVQEEKKIKEADPTVDWNKEYENFANTTYTSGYIDFLNSFYSGHRYMHQFIGGNIAYFDALGLIELKGNEINSLTPKGKYFALRTKEKFSQAF